MGAFLIVALIAFACGFVACMVLFFVVYAWAANDVSDRKTQLERGPHRLWLCDGPESGKREDP